MKKSLLTEHEAVGNLVAIPGCFVQAAEERTELRISLLVPPRPPRGGPRAPGTCPSGAESLLGKGPPGPGRGNLDNEFVPLCSPDAGGTEAGLAASTPGSTVGAQLVKILFRTGRFWARVTSRLS